MLYFLDVLFSLLHLTIILFNMFGWVFPATRKAHLVLIAVTAFCWFILGIWFGWGYCPLTDWQWQVKEQLGETNLPASFVTYFLNKTTSAHFSDASINLLTVIIFISAAALSVYFNFAAGKRNRIRKTRNAGGPKETA